MPASISEAYITAKPYGHLPHLFKSKAPLVTLEAAIHGIYPLNDISDMNPVNTISRR